MSDITSAHSQALYLNERLRERVDALEAENAGLRDLMLAMIREAEAELARLNKVWLEAQQRATKAGKERTELFEREQAALAELGERQRECARLIEKLKEYEQKYGRI